MLIFFFLSMHLPSYWWFPPPFELLLFSDTIFLRWKYWSNFFEVHSLCFLFDFWFLLLFRISLKSSVTFPICILFFLFYPPWFDVYWDLLICNLLLLSIFFREYLCSSSEVKVLLFGLILLWSPESSTVSLLFVTEEPSFVVTTIFGVW